ncbi:MAG: hypothetical protein ACJAWZ_001915, partial [Paracoccaceae bacterium]
AKRFSKSSVLRLAGIWVGSEITRKLSTINQ